MVKKISLILILLFTSSFAFAETDSFIDIKESDWFYDDVIELRQENIISGYDDSTFKPNTNISIEEFITLTVKVLKKEEADVEKKRWSDGFIKKAYDIKLIEEDEFDDYTKMISRGEMSRIILRAADLNVPNNYMEYGSMISDYEEMSFYWKDIASKVYSIGIISGYPDGRFDLNGLATRAEASAILMKIHDPSRQVIRELISTEYSNRVKEIKDAWALLKPKDYDSVYIRDAVLTSPYFEGVLSKDFIDNGLNMLNFIRELAYLSPNSFSTNESNNIAQHGAVLLATSNFSHTPKKPENMSYEFYNTSYEATSTSNLAAGISTLSEAVKRLIDDKDVSNIDRVGHRRWFLFPNLFEVGFGHIETDYEYRYYSAIKVFGDLDTVPKKKNEVMWPSKTAFPLEYFDLEVPWSVSLDTDIYDNKRVGTINVIVENQISGVTWKFDYKDTNLNGKYFNVETSGFGTAFCIIFRPDYKNEIEYKDGDNIKVTINNLYLTNGSMTSLEYETTFFNLN